MINQGFSASLRDFLPEGSVEIVSEWLVNYKISLKIVRERNTKLGDYRCPSSLKGHRISVNGNMNPYSFLITLVHEMAHLLVWEKYRGKVYPHGKEWKQTYADLILEFISARVFPYDVHVVLENSLLKTKANSYGNIKLSRVLKKYDLKETGSLVEDVPDNTVFKLQNGLTFKKIRKNRIRYRCLCLENKRIYSVHPLAKVISVLN